MSRDSNFVPLAELENYSSERLAWRINLPEYAPADRIGVNVGRLEYLARLSGLAHLRVEGRGGETSSETPMVGSIDSQGNATATMASIKTKAELQKTELDAKRANDRNALSEYIWGDGIIRVNSSELGKKVLDASRSKDGPSVREPRTWTKQLDKALTHGITQAARGQLLSSTFRSRLFFGLFAFYTGLSIIRDAPDEVLRTMMMNSAILQIIPTINQPLLFHHPIRGRRISLIPCYQVDRLAVVNAVARTRKLVKTIG